MVGLCWTSRQGTTPAAATQSTFFSPYPLSNLAWPCHFCQSTSLSSAFLLPAVASPTCCLLPSPLSPTPLRRQGWRVYTTILRIFGQPCRPPQWDLPLWACLPWRNKWERDCRWLLMAKQVMSVLLDFSVCADCRKLLGGRHKERRSRGTSHDLTSLEHR